MINVTRIQEIAKHGFDDAVDILSCIALAEASNDPEMRNEFGTANLAVVTIRMAMFLRIVITTARVYDPIRKGDFHVGVAIAELKADKALFQAVAATGDTSRLHEAIQRYDEALADPREKRLRHSRNKLGAHLSDPDPKIDPALLLDLFAFGSRTATVCERLAWGAGVHTLSVREFAAEYEGSARELWERVARGAL